MSRLRDNDQRELVRRRFEVVALQDDRPALAGIGRDGLRIGNRRLIDGADVDGEGRLRFFSFVVLREHGDGFGTDETAA